MNLNNNMIAIFFVILLCGVFYLLGIVSANYKNIGLEEDLSNTNSIAQGLATRAPIYRLIREGDIEKLSLVYESLLYGDLLAASLLDKFSAHNRDMICANLVSLRLPAEKSTNRDFKELLAEAIVKCNQ